MTRNDESHYGSARITPKGPFRFHSQSIIGNTTKGHRLVTGNGQIKVACLPNLCSNGIVTPIQEIASVHVCAALGAETQKAGPWNGMHDPFLRTLGESEAAGDDPPPADVDPCRHEMDMDS